MRRTTALWLAGGLSALALSALAGGALAQQAKPATEIVLTDANVSQAYVALGAVTASAHQKSLFGKASMKDVLDAQLRAEAAKLGADAVVQVRYTIRNGLTSDKGSEAIGVAIKYTGSPPVSTASAAPAPTPPAAPAAAPSAAPPKPAAPQALGAAAPTPMPAPAPAATAASSQTAPAPKNETRPVSSAQSPAAPAPAIIAAATAKPTDAALIMLTQQDITARRYQRLGEVRAEVHQKSVFGKTPPQQTLENDLKAQAAKLGADAVILVKYDMSNALTSTKGSSANGVAVKFLDAPPAAAPTQVALAASAAASAAAPSVPGASPAASAPPAPAAVRHAISVDTIIITDQALTNQRYTKVGEVRSVVHQKSIVPSTSPKQQLDADLRAQAAKLGADAIIEVHYEMNSPMMSTKGNIATGVAVRFE